MFRVASGVTDQVVYFEGLSGGSAFTVDISQNGSALSAMTTPTVTELGSTGTYTLLMDENAAIGAGNLTEAIVFHINGTAFSEVKVFVELFDPNNYTVGTVTTNTDMRGTENAALASSFSFTGGNVDSNVVKVAGGADISAGGATTPAYAEP